MTAPHITETTATIQTPTGQRVVRAGRVEGVNGLVITMLASGMTGPSTPDWFRWTITHRASGRRITRGFDTATEAARIAVALVDVADWMQSEEELNANAQAIGSRMAAILHHFDTERTQ